MANFYLQLQHYSPLCYGGQGAPFFMTHRGCSSPLICLLVIDGFIGVAFAIAYAQPASPRLSPAEDAQQRHFILTLNLLNCVILNVLFLLTLFVNPGIVDPQELTREQFQEEGREFCEKCRKRRTGTMRHCFDCKVCVRNLDHHCGFFDKCIGGKQVYCFYMLLLSLFACFLTVMVTLASATS